MDKFLGKRLDERYEIQEIIGVGGMAVVYKARDNVENRIVAVKILRDEFTSNEEFIRRFKNESKAIAMLSHQNIVKVYDVSFGNIFQYIVMEYIDGITLKEYIESRGSLGWKDAVYFTMQILKALQHAHDKGIVHRDVKPQNIMVLSDGTIKVTDFGIARFARSEQRTITDKAIGSVHYISPEQARGERTDEKADIYSVGVMLYEMLTGQLPFEAESAVSVAIMQLQRDPKPLTEVNSSIPLGLEQITMHAMQKITERRYQCAAEMLCDLDAFRKDPAKTFENTYFVDDAPTKYVSENLRSATPASEDVQEEAQEENDNREKSNIVPILSGIAAALLVVLIVVGIFVWRAASSGTGESYECENFVGMTLENIESNADYDVKYDFEYEYVFDEKPKGTVIKQSLKAGKSIKGENNKIVLTVSKGADSQPIPNLEDYEETAAREILEDMGLKVKTEPKESMVIEEGNVIEANFEWGTHLNEGDTIILYISSGSSGEVDDYSGWLSSQAEEDIKKSGFKVKVEKKDLTGSDKFIEENRVISQKPAAETSLKKGGEVIIYVSTGKVNYNFDVSIKNLPDDFAFDNTTVSLWVNGEEFAKSKTISLTEKGYGYTFKGLTQSLSGESANKNPELNATVKLSDNKGKYYACMDITIDLKTGKITDYTTLDDYLSATESSN